MSLKTTPGGFSHISDSQKDTKKRASINFTHLIIEVQIQTYSSLSHTHTHNPIEKVYLCGLVHVVHADEAFIVLFMARIIVSQKVDEPDREGFLIQLGSYHSRLNQIRTKCNFNGASALQFHLDKKMSCAKTCNKLRYSDLLLPRARWSSMHLLLIMTIVTTIKKRQKLKTKYGI